MPRKLQPINPTVSTPSLIAPSVAKDRKPADSHRMPPAVRPSHPTRAGLLRWYPCHGTRELTVEKWYPDSTPSHHCFVARRQSYRSGFQFADCFHCEIPPLKVPCGIRKATKDLIRAPRQIGPSATPIALSDAPAGTSGGGSNSSDVVVSMCVSLPTAASSPSLR